MKRFIYVFWILLIVGFAGGCKKSKDYIYDVSEVDSKLPNADKRSLKTDEQYIAILYANLFQRALSADQVNEIKRLIDSVGDKETVREVIISSFMNDPDVIIPSRDEALADLDKFIDETYLRFFVRHPSEAEKAWFNNYITSNEVVTPELIYISFSISDEYLYY